MFRWLLNSVEALRAGAWPRVRREHLLKEPVCIACGRSKDLEVHHVLPLSHGGAELDPTNLITLCADPCHLVHGHLMAWTRANPEVREDCARYRAKLEKAKNG
jgi:5-methylcytosine-specific restriction endonuclease McrA